MTITHGYCMAEELEAHLLTAGTFTSGESSQLEMRIEAASRAIDEVCGRRFWLDSSVATRAYRADDGLVAWTDDIGTLTGLVVKTDPNLDGSWSETWTIATDFEVWPLNASADGDAWAVWRLEAVGARMFPVARRATVQVTAKFGWSEVPKAIREACLALASRLEFSRRNPAGIANFAEFGAVRIAREDPVVSSLLGPFHKMRVGAV